VAHFSTGFVGCEHLFNLAAGDISLTLAIGNFAADPFWVIGSPIEALSAQHVYLDLAMLDQLARLGVWWNSRRRKCARPRRAGKSDTARRQCRSTTCLVSTSSRMH
jgi:hypothetical protein